MCEHKRVFRHPGTQVEGCGVWQGSSRMLLARWQQMLPMSSSSRSGLDSEAISGSGITSHQLRLGKVSSEMTAQASPLGNHACLSELK